MGKTLYKYKPSEPIAESDAGLKIVHGTELRAAVKDDSIANIETQHSMEGRVVLENSTKIRREVEARETPQTESAFSKSPESIETKAGFSSNYGAGFMGIADGFRVDRKS